MKLDLRLLILALPAIIACGTWNRDNPFDAATAHLGSLSSTDVMPFSVLTITGTGFGTSNVAVRFSDTGSYQLDVPAIKSAPDSVSVFVPPYMVPGAFDGGTVKVQVLQVSGADTTKSNGINVQIQSLPMPTVPNGTVTLNLFTDELAYLDTIQAQVAGTAMETPAMDSAISANIANLTWLTAQIRTTVQTSAPFTFGTVNGTPITIGTKELLQSDRLILALFNSNPNLAKRLAAGVACTPIDGQDFEFNSGEFTQKMNCAVASAPSAVSTVFGIALGSGGAGMGALCLTLWAFDVAVPPMGFALSAAMLTCYGIMYAGSEFALAAELKNIDNTAAYQAIQKAAKQTEDILTGLVTGGIYGETGGYIKQMGDGYEQITEAMATSPLANTGCTFALASSSQTFTANGGNGAATMISQGGCKWETGVDNVDWIVIALDSVYSGTGTVSFTVLPNTTTGQRTGSIFLGTKEFVVTQAAGTAPPAGAFDGMWRLNEIWVYTYTHVNCEAWRNGGDEPCTDTLSRTGIDDVTISKGILTDLYGDTAKLDATGNATWGYSDTTQNADGTYDVNYDWHTGTFTAAGNASGTYATGEISNSAYPAYDETIIGVGTWSGVKSGTTP
jgi:Putative binding domain, N-terminal